MCRQIFFFSAVSHPAISNAAPVGAVGIDFPTAYSFETKKWRKMALTITMTGGPGDVSLWVRDPRDVSSDATDDVWSLFQDMYGVIKRGKLETALPNGVYSYVIPDIGPYAGIYVQASAGTVSAVVKFIDES